MPERTIGLSSPLTIGSITVRNRIVLPPMVVSSAHSLRRQGLPDPATLDRYTAIARGGVGLMVVEATVVLAEGRGWDGMLGLWNNLQAEAFLPLTQDCRAEGAVILVQLQHHGIHTNPALGEPVSASRFISGITQARSMTRQEISEIRDAFVAAAGRAAQAGFDGVELHACHGYLLNQFLDSTINRRTDEYGGSIENRTRLVREIIEGIRQTCPADFLISVRMAGNCPHLADGIRVAQALEAGGADMLSVAFGMSMETAPKPEPDFPFSPLCNLGCEIKKNVTLPVAAVGGLSRAEDAARLISEDYADLAVVGRGHLIHPNWAFRALNGHPISPCIGCAKCAWYTRNPEECPAFLHAKPI